MWDLWYTSVAHCRGDPIPNTLIEKVDEYIPDDFAKLLNVSEVSCPSHQFDSLLCNIFLLTCPLIDKCLFVTNTVLFLFDFRLKMA